MSDQEVPIEHPRPVRRKLAANQIGIIAKEIKFFSQITTKSQHIPLADASQARPAHFSQVRTPSDNSKKKLHFVENNQGNFGLNLSRTPIGDRQGSLTPSGYQGAGSPAKSVAVTLEEAGLSANIATAEKQKSESKDETKESSTKLSDAYAGHAVESEAAEKKPTIIRCKNPVYDVIRSAKNLKLQNSIYEEDDEEISCDSLNDSLDDIPASSKTGIEGTTSMSMSYRRKF